MGAPNRGLKPDPGVYHVIRAGDEAKLAKVVDHIAKLPLYGIDTETTGLSSMGDDRTQGDRTVGYCLSFAQGSGVYIPFDHADPMRGRVPGQLEPEVVFDILRPLLEESDAVPIFHNAQFDYFMIRKDGIRPRQARCTLNAARIISWATGRWDPKGGDGVRSLKSLTEELLGHTVIRLEELFPPGTKDLDFSRLDPFNQRAVDYASADASNTLGVYDRMMSILETYDLLDVWELESRLIIPNADMIRRGVLVDFDYCDAKGDEGARLAAEAAANFLEIAAEKLEKPEDLEFARKCNVGSGKQLGDLLFDRLGYEPVGGRTAKGGYVTDKKTLKKLSAMYPEIGLLLTSRAIAKNIGTYFRGYRKFLNPDTGRVHSNFKPLGTETGRYASSEPNLQNMTKKGMEFDLGDRVYRARVRDAIVSSPEYYFIDFDYSQVEYRALAGEAGEVDLIQAINDGVDAHRATAASVFSVPIEDVTSDQRDRGKTVNFSLLYGQGIPATADKLGISIAEAEALVNTYFSKLPAINRWMERIKIECRRNKFVRTPFGRQRYVPEVMHPAQGMRERGDRIAVNTVIQGGCADITKFAIIRSSRDVQAKWPGLVHLVLTVHDSLTFEVHESIPVEEAYAVIKNAMIIEVPGWPRLDVDCKVGYRYGSLSDYDPEVEFEWPLRDQDPDALDVVPEEDEDPTELSEDADPIAEPAPSSVGAGFADSVKGIEVSFSGPATHDRVVQLVGLLNENPGDLTVSLRVSGTVVEMPPTSLTPDSLLWVQRLGPVSVVSVSSEDSDPLSGMEFS